MSAAAMRARRGLPGAVLMLCTLVAMAPAQAFESVEDDDILGRGPTMGPIDAERPMPKYVRKGGNDDPAQATPDTKRWENFEEMGLDMRPVWVEPRPRMGLELRFGPYRPAYSGHPGAHRLYNLMMVEDDKSLFGGRPILMALEGSYYFLRDLGLLGAYGRVGYWHAEGASRACVDAEGALVPCTKDTVFSSIPGNDTAALTVMPLSAGVVWRVDTLKRRTPVPLVATAKLGLDGHFWWGSSGGRRALYAGDPARGVTLGWQASAGVSLNLDGLGKHTLSRMRSKVESNLFIEFATVRGAALVGSRRADRLNFTDNRLITVGIACDFK